MPDWACRKCGAINLEAQDECEGCGKQRTRTVIPFPVTPTPEWQTGTPACTQEENYRAAENLKAVLNQEITLHQAHHVLHAIFEGRELDDGVTTCACGIELPTPQPARR